MAENTTSPNMSELDSLAARAVDLASKVDYWNNAVLVFLFVTALAGAAIFAAQRTANLRAKKLSVVQSRISEIKESEAKTERVRLNKDLADALRGIADANQKAEAEHLARVQIEARIGSRRFPGKVFTDALAAKPTGDVVVMYQPQDPEAFKVALDIVVALHSSGWDSAAGPVPIPPDLIDPLAKGTPLEGFERSLPPSIRAGAGPPIAIITNSLQDIDFLKPDVETAFGALWFAFSEVAAKAGGNFESFGAGRDATLPQNTFRIIVGPRP